MDSEIFGKMPPTRLFFHCAVPAVVTSVFGALYSVVDGVFVGRYLGEDALAAVNLVMPVIMIVEALSNMIATGASVNISILLGEQKREEASRVFSFSVRFILLFSCLIGLLGYFYADFPRRRRVGHLPRRGLPPGLCGVFAAGTDLLRHGQFSARLRQTKDQHAD